MNFLTGESRKINTMEKKSVLRCMTMNDLMKEAAKIPDVIFENIGLKFICEHESTFISTWHCVLDKPIPEIINEMKYIKNWMGGRFTEIYLEFENKEMKYQKYYLDVNQFNSLLKGK